MPTFSLESAAFMAFLLIAVDLASAFFFPSHCSFTKDISNIPSKYVNILLINSIFIDIVCDLVCCVL